MSTFDDLAAGDRFLTTAEVAALFRVDTRTVGRWALKGWIASTLTPGGRRRFLESEVRIQLDLT